MRNALHIVRMNKKHYAMQWRLNAVHANTGTRCADYYYFSSRSERDKWASEGALYRGRGFREHVSANDPELRRLQNLERAREEVGLWIEKH